MENNMDLLEIIMMFTILFMKSEYYDVNKIILYEFFNIFDMSNEHVECSKIDKQKC